MREINSQVNLCVRRVRQSPYRGSGFQQSCRSDCDTAREVSKTEDGKERKKERKKPCLHCFFFLFFLFFFSVFGTLLLSSPSDRLAGLVWSSQVSISRMEARHSSSLFAISSSSSSSCSFTNFLSVGSPRVVALSLLLFSSLLFVLQCSAVQSRKRTSVCFWGSESKT